MQHPPWVLLPSPASSLVGLYCLLDPQLQQHHLPLEGQGLLRQAAENVEGEVVAVPVGQSRKIRFSACQSGLLVLLGPGCTLSRLPGLALRFGFRRHCCLLKLHHHR